MEPNGRERLAFTGTDHRGLRVLLWATAFVVVAVELIAPVISGIVRDPIRATVHTEVTVDGLAPGVTVANPADVLVVIADPTMSQRLLVALPSALVGVAVLVVVRHLLGLLGDLRGGEPFTVANVRRLRGIAVVVGTGAIVVSAAEALCDFVLVADGALGAGARQVFQMSLPLAFLAVALVIAAIAEAYRVGVRLRDDVDGLV